MPGAQALNDGFTGRRSPKAAFFLSEEHYERGKHAVRALADLVLAYEADASSSGVVMGIQLLNEPTNRYLETPRGIKAFYAEMVPEVRRKLPATRYMIMLSFMDSPHERSARWLAAARELDPFSFAGVVHDTHLYHLFGDNTNPWGADMDMCKTCCRDSHILKPMWSLDVPTVLGEYSLSTGFWGWQDDGFEQMHFENQLSLWNTTRAVVGSFTWNFRILLAETR